MTGDRLDDPGTCPAFERLADGDFAECGESLPCASHGTFRDPDVRRPRWDVVRPYVVGLLFAAVARVLAEVAAAGHVFVSAVLISFALVGASWWGKRRVLFELKRAVAPYYADPDLASRTDAGRSS